jgi:hypothetical protein
VSRGGAPTDNRLRRRFVHLIVTNLTVPRRWRVGSTTLYPAGDLLNELDAELARKDPPVRSALDNVGDVRDFRWATIRVPVLAPGGRVDEATIDQARDVARDSVAVQRTLVRRFSLERQTFGLSTDIGSVTEPRWVTDTKGRFTSRGLQLHGIFSHWDFKSADVRAYHADPRFAYLDRALAANSPDDWQGRAVTAVRTMNVATIMQRPATRIILLATALEALLGNRFQPDAAATGAHRLAKRAAYLWCGSDVQPPSLHRPGARPACGLLTAASSPRADPTMYDKATRRWGCSWYGAIRELYDDRNAALHGAASRFDPRAASMHEFNMDHVVLAAVEWVLERRPASIDDLDADIVVLPVA